MTRRGFTLFEMLVALALVLLLMGALFSFFFDVLSMRRRAIDEAATQRAAIVLVERLEDDLFCALAGDPVHGPGVRGDATSITVLTRSVPAALAERGRGDATILADLQRTSYRHRAGAVEVRREHAIEPPSGDAAWEPLGGTLARVRFRFHDGSAWRDRFDSSAAGGLPAAVEVAVWFRPWPGDEPVEDEESGGADPQRRTFDASGAFDEAAFLEEAALEALGEPDPDRVRVIVIPDAAPGPEGEARDG